MVCMGEVTVMGRVLLGLFVLCTHKCTRYGPCPSQAPPSPPLSPRCQGVFHLSGLIHCQYPEVELHSLGRVFSVRKYTPLESRTTHPYMLLDDEWCHMLLTGLIYMGTCRSHDLCHMPLGDMLVTCKSHSGDGSLVCTIVHIILS